METLRNGLRRIASLYRMAFWVMLFSSSSSALLIYSALSAASKHHSHTVHWNPALKYLLPAAGISWLVWRMLGRMSARYFSYVIDYSDINSFGGGGFSARQVHRYTRLYRRHK